MFFCFYTGFPPVIWSSGKLTCSKARWQETFLLFDPLYRKFVFTLQPSRHLRLRYELPSRVFNFFFRYTKPLWSYSRFNRTEFSRLSSIRQSQSTNQKWSTKNINFHSGRKHFSWLGKGLTKAISKHCSNSTSTTNQKVVRDHLNFIKTSFGVW